MSSERYGLFRKVTVTHRHTASEERERMRQRTFKKRRKLCSCPRAQVTCNRAQVPNKMFPSRTQPPLGCCVPVRSVRAEQHSKYSAGEAGALTKAHRTASLTQSILVCICKAALPQVPFQMRLLLSSIQI